MTIVEATRWAEATKQWLAPYCERLEVAGSIRRQRPNPNDIDIVCIPKRTVHTDLLGAVTSADNHAWQFLQDYVRDRNPSGSQLRAPRFLSGGDREGKQVIIQLPKCQLDLWFADEGTWGTRLLCRTGSKDHNIWLCERARGRVMKWNPFDGLSSIDTGKQLMTETEAAVYAALGLEWIEPKLRESEWLRRNIDSGL